MEAGAGGASVFELAGVSSMLAISVEAFTFLFVRVSGKRLAMNSVALKMPAV